MNTRQAYEHYYRFLRISQGREPQVSDRSHYSALYQASWTLIERGKAFAGWKNNERKRRFEWIVFDRVSSWQ